MFGRPLRGDALAAKRGGMFDPSGIEELVREAVPFGAIAEHMRAGLLSALSISTTHVASGRTTVFIQRRDPGASALGDRPDDGRASRKSKHSTPSRLLRCRFFSQQSRSTVNSIATAGFARTCLLPARRLGADGLIVINPRYIREELVAPALAEERERTYPIRFSSSCSLHAHPGRRPWCRENPSRRSRSTRRSSSTTPMEAATILMVTSWQPASAASSTSAGTRFAVGTAAMGWAANSHVAAPLVMRTRVGSSRIGSLETLCTRRALAASRR